MNAGLLLAAIALASSASAAFINDWRPKFYEGLEAIAEVKTVPGGYDGAKPCVELRHISGKRVLHNQYICHIFLLLGDL